MSIYDEYGRRNLVVPLKRYEIENYANIAKFFFVSKYIFALIFESHEIM